MTTKDEALRIALDALKIAVRQNSHDMLMTGEELRKCEAAITAIKQAQEPVGINGLTEAETSASMSVMGLSKPAPKQAQEPVPYGIVYEYDDYGGTHQSFSYRERNGKYPDRSVKVYAEPAPKQAEPTQINLEQIVRNELNEAMRPHAEAIDREVFAKASQPEGYKLVPVEPTPEMCAAGAAYMNAPVELISKNAVSFYSAMLAAAPEAQ